MVYVECDECGKSLIIDNMSLGLAKLLSSCWHITDEGFHQCKSCHEYSNLE